MRPHIQRCSFRADNKQVSYEVGFVKLKPPPLSRTGEPFMCRWKYKLLRNLFKRAS